MMTLFVRVLTALVIATGLSATPALSKAETCDLSVLRDAVDAVPPGTWVELSDTQMRPILLREDDPVMGHGIWGGTGSESVIRSWNGAAFSGCEWYFFGGGHMNYGGNEVYRFRLEDQSWARLTDPTPFLPASKDNPCAGTTDINKPVVGHVVDGIIHSRRTETVFLWSTSIYCDEWHTLAGAHGKNPETGRREVWEFDPSTLEWQWLGPSPENWSWPHTATDPQTGNIIYCRVSHCQEFDPVSKTYSRKSPAGLIPSKPNRLTWGPATFDSRRRHIVVLARDRIYSAPVDGISIGRLTQVARITDLGNLDEYGIAYDSVRDLLVLWHGGSKLFTVAPGSWDVKQVVTTGTILPIRATRGVFSRWEYIAAIDAFMGMDNADQGFWLIRLPANSEK